MKKTVKLADIAKRVGVSTVTVSKALSGQKGVSEDVRARIRALAEELGYRQPSVARREAALRKSYHIGVLVGEEYLGTHESFYWQMYQQVSARALESGCYALLEVVGGGVQGEGGPILPEILKEDKVQGLIVLGRLRQGYLDFLRRSCALPVVYLDFTDGAQGVDAVTSDGFYGAYYVTNYLFSMGHRRIAYVGTLSASGSIMDRYLGYVKSLREHGLEPRQDWLLEDRDPASGFIEEGVMRLPEEMPTAFFCNCDLTAGRLIRKLTASGFRVPEEVSVAGFDDYLSPGACDVGLTTYEVDQAAMAKRAVSLLRKRMDGEEFPAGTHVIGGRLVVRDSVGTVGGKGSDRAARGTDGASAAGGKDGDRAV